MTHAIRITALVCSCAILWACVGTPNVAAREVPFMRAIPGQPMGAVQLVTDGMRLVNRQGEAVRLRGINLIDKGSRVAGGWRFIPDWPEDLMDRFAQSGINLVRLGILWAAVEPSPGQYDETYFDFIGRQLDLAEQAGIAVILDMHQDLYAQRFSDGAPDWAVLTDKPYTPTPLWSDAYLFSEAVQESWEAFWANAPVPNTGIGLQDHFAGCWRTLAARFHGHPALLGYDLLNEPAPGSEIQGMFGLLLGNFLSLLTDAEREALGVTPGDVDGMAAAFTDPARKLAMLEILNDADRFRQLGEMSSAPVIAFERDVLTPFIDRVATAIREVDGTSFLLRGHNYISNIGVPSGITPIMANGQPDPRQVFAPHGYDLVVDTPAIGLASDSRAHSIFARHRETQLALNLPVIVTEWGALGGSPVANTHGKYLVDLFESWGWGHTYWCYEPGYFATPMAGMLKALP